MSRDKKFQKGASNVFSKDLESRNKSTAEL